MRTLQNWCKAVAEGVLRRPPGRPPHGLGARTRALLAVCRELRRQGYATGAVTIWEALCRGVPLRLVRWATKRLKQRKERRRRCMRERVRQSVHVQKRDVLWSLDGTHLGRAAHAPVEGQVAKDVGTLCTVGLSVGPPARGQDLVRLLKQTKVRRGTLPLVLSSDNGSANTSHVVARFLEAEKIVHLKSVPHTPQHNAWAERGIGELKQDSGLGKGVQTSASSAAARLEASQRRLDHERLRRSRGFRTAVQCDRDMPSWYGGVSRARFYKAARRAIKAAVIGEQSSRAQRMQEREAIFATMEYFGLITRTRGGEPLRAKKHEDVS